MQAKIEKSGLIFLLILNFNSNTQKRHEQKSAPAVFIFLFTSQDISLAISDCSAYAICV